MFLKKIVPFFSSTKANSLSWLCNLRPGQLTSSVSTDPWRIQRFQIYKDILARHLALPWHYPFQESGFKTLAHQTEVRSVQSAYRFTPENPRSPVAAWHLGLHDDAQVSVWVFAKSGVSNQVQRALESPAGEGAPAGQFISAPRVGFDIRPRQSLMIKVNEEDDIKRLESFLAGIQRCSPFDSVCLNIIQNLLNQCRSQLREKQIWQPLIEAPVENLTDELRGYPNEFPDPADLSSNYRYDRQDSLNFPQRIPSLHLAVLAADGPQIDRLLSEDPSRLYQRDPWGNLAIEVALDLKDYGLAFKLYTFWKHLPEQEKQLFDLFYDGASDIWWGSSELVFGISPQMRQIHVDKYFSRLLPDLPTAGQVYVMAVNQDVTSYEMLTQHWRDQQRALHRAAEQQAFANLIEIAIAELPEEFALFASILKGDWVQIETYLADALPDENHRMLLKNKRQYYPCLAYIEALKAQWRAETLALSPRDAVAFLQQALDTELNHWSSLNEALNSKQDDAVKQQLQRKVGEQSLEQIFSCRSMSFGDYLGKVKETFFGPARIPAALLLIFCAKQQNQAGVNDIVQRRRESLERTLTLYPDLTAVKAAIETHIPKRPQAHLDIIAKKALSTESSALQDPWGYTPLLLAVITNHLEYVRACFRAGVFSTERIKIPCRARMGHYYTLLEHASSAEMVNLLMHYYYNPNEGVSILAQGRWDMSQSLLRYGHRPQRDKHLMTLLDNIIRGRSNYDKPVEVLKSLLMYYDHDVTEGPFDATVDAKVAEVLRLHNRKRDTQKQMRAQLPKIRDMESQPDAIVTRLASPDDPGLILYENKIMPLRAVEENSALFAELACVFVASYRMREHDSIAVRKAFLLDYIKKHPEFYIEIYQDAQANGRIIGFTTFALKERGDQGYNVIYLAMAACRAGSKGLPLTTFRVIHAAYALSQEQGRELYFYGRFGRPGLIIKLMVPGPWSIKFYTDPKHTREVTVDVVGNELNAQGASTPPVISQAKLHSDWFRDRELEEYYHLLEQLNAGPEDSLPLVVRIDDAMLLAWLKKMSDHNGMTQAHMDEFISLFIEKYKTGFAPEEQDLRCRLCGDSCVGAAFKMY